MSNWEHPTNDGWQDIEYEFGLKGDDAGKLSKLLNEACHVYRHHAEGVWTSDDKDSYAKAIMSFTDRHPTLESRLLRSGDHVIKMLVYRAIELRK